jgi:CheY-like chemotaxis protein
VAQAAFDLVLMDAQMPVMNGLDATREIRRREAADGGRRTPILALTANVMQHQLDDYVRAGMDGWVGKPIEAHKLFAAIQLAVAASAADAAAAA